MFCSQQVIFSMKNNNLIMKIMNKISPSEFENMKRNGKESFVLIDVRHSWSIKYPILEANMFP